MTTDLEVKKATSDQLDEMLEIDLTPSVECAKDVNKGFCWYFAENVYDRLGQPEDVHILGCGTMSGNHRWIECNGTHYDSEALQGVEEWKNLPFWRRITPHNGLEPKNVGHRH